MSAAAGVPACLFQGLKKYLLDYYVHVVARSSNKTTARQNTKNTSQKINNNHHHLSREEHPTRSQPYEYECEYEYYSYSYSYWCTVDYFREPLEKIYLCSRNVRGVVRRNFYVLEESSRSVVSWFLRHVLWLQPIQCFDRRRSQKQRAPELQRLGSAIGCGNPNTAPIWVYFRLSFVRWCATKCCWKAVLVRLLRIVLYCIVLYCIVFCIRVRYGTTVSF